MINIPLYGSVIIYFIRAETVRPITHIRKHTIQLCFLICQIRDRTVDACQAVLVLCLLSIRVCIQDVPADIDSRKLCPEFFIIDIISLLFQRTRSAVQLLIIRLQDLQTLTDILQFDSAAFLLPLKFRGIDREYDLSFCHIFPILRVPRKNIPVCQICDRGRRPAVSYDTVRARHHIDVKQPHPDKRQNQDPRKCPDQYRENRAWPFLVYLCAVRHLVHPNYNRVHSFSPPRDWCFTSSAYFPPIFFSSS